MARTCCPQYTIRLDAGEFKPNKKQRQAMNRWNRFVGEGVKPGEDGGGVPTACGSGAEGMQGKGKAKGKGKGKSRAGEIGFLETLLQYEAGYGQEGKHRSEVGRLWLAAWRFMIFCGGTVLRGCRRYSHRRSQPRRLSSCTSDIRWRCTRTNPRRSR
jgi:hypothetical protein